MDPDKNGREESEEEGPGKEYEGETSPQKVASEDDDSEQESEDFSEKQFDDGSERVRRKWP